jgi:electron transfer flavoprotein beta subunit
MPNLKGKIRAKKIEIPVLGVDDIEADPAMIGLKNSPTRVVKAFRPQLGRSGEIVRAEDGLDNAVDGLVNFLAENSLV